MPASIATLSGPEHRYRFFNAHYQTLSGNRTQVGLTVAEVFPEVIEQGFIGLLDQVYATGKPFIGLETPAHLHDPATGRPEQRYLDFIYQPLFGEEGQTQGILAFIVDVTEKVQARQRIDALQAELLLKAQHQVRERETLYQVFEQTPAAICLRRGPEHRYSYVNPAYQALFPDRELVGRSLVETLPETAPQGFVSLLDKVYRTGETFFGQELPLTLTRADGSVLRTLYLNFTYQAYRENGEIVGISTFAYEVSEPVLARREAERHRLLLHTLFMEAPAAICILDGPDLIYQLVNPTYQQLFPGRSLLGKSIAEALPEIVHHEVLRTFRQVYQTGTTHREQGILIPIARLEDGRLEDRYFNYIQQARFNADGGIDGVLVFAFEVTDQVLARKKVEESEQDLRNLVLTAPMGVCLLDGPTLVVEVVNGHFVEVAGRPAEAIVGKWYWEAFAEARPSYEAALQGVVDTGEPYYANEVELMLMRHGKQERVYVTFVYQAMKDWEGKVKKVVVFVLENTPQVVARKRVEESQQQALALAQQRAAANQELAALNEELQAANEQIQSTNERLKRANVDLDTFVYSASHDLKSPVISLDALLSRLATRLAHKLDKREQEMLTLIQSSSQRLQQTIKDLTQIAQVQRDVQEDKTLINFEEVLSEIQADLASQLEESGAQLVVDFEVESLPYTRKNLRSILYNLLSNAIKYRSPERVPQILIRTYQQEGRTELTISDNGLGLTEPQRQGMFAMFKRFHNHVEGSGVGLNIVKRIIENNGGQITLESRLNQGTTFQILF